MPVIASPDFNRLREADPMIFAVIVPAEKFPPLSLSTIVEGVFEEVALPKPIAAAAMALAD
jgi:hypothetical protein